MQKAVDEAVQGHPPIPSDKVLQLSWDDMGMSQKTCENRGIFETFSMGPFAPAPNISQQSTKVARQCGGRVDVLVQAAAWLTSAL